MRALAAAADVTVVTAYNLFGSRENVIAAVFEEDLENFNARLLERGGGIRLRESSTRLI